mgnify:FL=1
MKNLKSNIEKRGATTFYTKTFDSKTYKGLDIQLKVWRKVINLGATPMVGKSHYAIIYKGKEVFWRLNKGNINHYINMVDVYGDTL